MDRPHSNKHKAFVYGARSVLRDVYFLHSGLHRARCPVLQYQYSSEAAHLYDGAIDITERSLQNGLIVPAFPTNLKILMMCIVRQVSLKSWANCLQESSQVNREANPMIRLVHKPPLPDALSALKNRTNHDVIATLATRNHRKQPANPLNLWSLNKFIDVVAITDDVRCQKPDPQGLPLVLQAVQISPHLVIDIGNIANNGHITKPFNVPVVAITGRFDPAAMPPVSVLMHDLRGLRLAWKAS